jgi:uncharacterized protein YraI
MKSRIAIAVLLAASLACSLPGGATPTPLVLPTLETPATVPAEETPPATEEPTAEPSPTVSAAATPGGVTIQPGSPSGPYAVILVAPGDVLNIRSGPGVANPVVASFAPTATNVMRTGPSALVGTSRWVEVQRPGGGTGWVNSYYLTEYVAPAAFCADARVATLLTDLGAALTAADGQALAALSSQTHGVDVRVWRHGANINFSREHLRWVFTSTFAHNWGPAPGTGDDTIGPFKDVARPWLLEVYGAAYEKHCNDVGVAAAFSMQPWPAEYANIGFFNLYKPGSPGIDLDWRIWLAGVEYVGGQPYLFSLIHFQWEP